CVQDREKHLHAVSRAISNTFCLSLLERCAISDVCFLRGVLAQGRAISELCFLRRVLPQSCALSELCFLRGGLSQSWAFSAFRSPVPPGTACDSPARQCRDEADISAESRRDDTFYFLTGNSR